MITYQAGSILQVAIALAVISQRLRSCICENNTNILRKSRIAAQEVILVPRKSIVIVKHIFFFFLHWGGVPLCFSTMMDFPWNRVN